MKRDEFNRRAEEFYVWAVDTLAEGFNIDSGWVCEKLDDLGLIEVSEATEEDGDLFEPGELVYSQVVIEE